MTSDLTLEVLKDIRDGVRATNERLDQTIGRLDQMEARLEHIDVRLEHMDGRLGNVEAAVLDLAQQQRFVVRYLKTLTRRDNRLAGEVAALRGRMDTLEVKVDSLSK